MLSLQKKLLLLLLLAAALRPAAQQGIQLTLVVNNKEKLSVYHDEPLVLSLFLTNPSASFNEGWNREASLGIAQLEKQLAEKKIDSVFFQQEKGRLQAGMKPTASVTVGNGAVPLAQQVTFFWTANNGETIEVPAKLLSKDSVKQTVLDAGAVHLLEWGISRDAVRKMKAGLYRLSASLGDHRSPAVAVQLKPESIPLSLLQTINTQATLGRFALRYGQTAEAKQHARIILKRQPSSVEGLVLMGDVNIENKAYAEALKNFEAALRSFRRRYPNSPEPPVYILETIAELNAQMKQQSLLPPH